MRRVYSRSRASRCLVVDSVTLGGPDRSRRNGNAVVVLDSVKGGDSDSGCGVRFPGGFWYPRVLSSLLALLQRLHPLRNCSAPPPKRPMNGQKKIQKNPHRPVISINTVATAPSAIELPPNIILCCPE